MSATSAARAESAPERSRTPGPLTAWFGRMPWWGRALVIWAASRAFSSILLTAVMLIGPAIGVPLPGHRTHVDFWSFSGLWDGTQYRDIVTDGYPLNPPMDAEGHMLHNAWAFLPVYPYLVKGLMLVTGLGFHPTGALVSLVASAGACVILFALAQRIADATRAGWTVALFALGPLAFVLQATYAEALFMALVFGALLLIVRQRYLLVAPVLVLAAFTRPGAVALGVSLLVVLIARWRSLRWAQRVSIVVSGVALGLATLAWPVIADAVTGEQSVYLRTEMDWGVSLVGYRMSAPFEPWFDLATTFLGGVGVLVVLVILALAAALLLRRRSRDLGLETWTFGVGYAVYLVAFFLPQQSTFRILMPMSPLLADAGITGRPRLRVILLVAGMVAQVAAVWMLWYRDFP